MDNIPFNAFKRNKALNSKLIRWETDNPDTVYKDIINMFDDEEDFDLKNLSLAAYLIVYSDTSSNTIDDFLNKYQAFWPKSIDETTFLPKWSFYGIYQHRYNKLRFLTSAVLTYFNEDQEKAFEEIKSIFMKALMNSEYRTIIRYINTIALNSKSIEKFWDYLDVKFNNLTKRNDIMTFMKYNMVYSFFVSIRYAQRLSDLAKKTKSHDLPNILEMMGEIESLVNFQKHVYTWTEERTQQEQWIVESKDIVNNSLHSRTEPIKLSLEKRVKLFIVSLILSGEMEQQLTNKDTEKILVEKTGYKNGVVNAAALINALEPFEKRQNDVLINEDLKKLFETQYLYEYVILKRHGVDMETLLSTTELNDEDLNEIVSSYALTGDFEHSIFRSLLSPINSYSSEPITLNDFKNTREAFVTGKDYLIRGIISTALGKHLRLASIGMDEIVFARTQQDDIKHEEAKSTNEIEEANEKIRILEAELRDSQNNNKLLRIQSQNKEHILREKLNAAEQEFSTLQKDHQLLKENYDMLFEDIETSDLEDDLENTVEEDSLVQNDEDINYLEAIRDLKICIVGGFDNFHRKISDAFPTEPTLVKSRFYNYPFNILLNQDVVVHVATHNNHSQYKRVKGYMKRNGIKNRLIPINAQHSPELLAKIIYQFINKREGTQND